MCAKCDKVKNQESVQTKICQSFIGMGKSQRYQAAVDGQKAALPIGTKLRRARHYGVRSRHTGFDRTRQTLGDSLAVVVVCAACLCAIRISMSPGGDIFFL